MSSRSQYTHLSETNPAWESVASKQSEIDKISGKLLALPIEEFRKITYRPPPLPEDAPTPGKDLNITHCEVLVRDGTKISIRIYKPLDPPDAALLFFNVHGGGKLLLQIVTKRIKTKVNKTGQAGSLVRLKLKKRRVDS
jgi:acetyl esterase/lipase